MQARGASPVLPLDQCDMHVRPEPGSLPRDHPGSGVVAPWLMPGQLHGMIQGAVQCLPRKKFEVHSNAPTAVPCPDGEGGLEGALDDSKYEESAM